ncbi:MAG: thermonuclease family protein [Actinomycetota bacterium]|nr:thermonuclease family protein [Actinomycetota bacterium]
MLRRVRRFLPRFFALGLALVLCACGPIDGATSPVGRPGERVEATVTRVVDGDTIHVSLSGQDVTIRLIGIDTPETVAPGQPIECFGPESSRFTTRQLTGARIELEYDRDLIDPFDRTLAYVWLDGRLFNETLVDRGYAEATSYPPDTSHQNVLDAAEVDARRADRGLWGAC